MSFAAFGRVMALREEEARQEAEDGKNPQEQGAKHKHKHKRKHGASTGTGAGARGGDAAHQNHPRRHRSPALAALGAPDVAGLKRSALGAVRGLFAD